VTAAEMLSRLVDELQQKGITIAIARAKRPLREKLGRIGLKEQFSEKTYFTSVHMAVEVFRQRKVL
jgi:sulfate permease, SulP family